MHYRRLWPVVCGIRANCRHRCTDGYGKRHNIRSGFQFDRVQDNFNALGVTRGQLRVQSFPDFLVGMSAAQNGSAFSNVFASVGIAGPTDRYFRANNYATFFQDNLKFNLQLTLNLGLRWEINGV